jgi:hypothetical protein
MRRQRGESATSADIGYPVRVDVLLGQRLEGRRSSTRADGARDQRNEVPEVWIEGRLTA